MRAIMAVLAGVIAIVTLAMLMGIKVDLQIAELFYEPSRQRFLARINSVVGLVRERGLVAWIVCGGFIGAALLTRLTTRLPIPAVPGRIVLFLVSTLALGPGLLVNTVLKDRWDRPRPVQITEFGGNLKYVDWWNPGGTCHRNCSFVSGEASSAAWLFAPAMLVPPPWRIAAYAGAAIFTVAISLARMAAGAHFLTDVLFAALLTMMVIWGMHWVIFRWRRTAAVNE